jgi:hypothetical protein
MKVFKALCLALLVLGTLCQLPIPNTNPSGIESGTAVVPLTSSPSTVVITFNDAGILAVPFFGLALIE